MKTHNRLHSFAFFASAFLLVASYLNATTYGTDFSGYTVGELVSGTNNWTTALGGNNTFFIAASGTQNPTIPTSLGTNGFHPISPTGGNMLWLSPRTSSVSSTNTAYFAFTDTASRVQEAFTLAFDIYASPTTSGDGQSFNFTLQQGTSTHTSAPQISFSSTGATTFNLAIRDNGTWSYGVVSLTKGTWLRFEFTIITIDNSSKGTWGLKVSTLDSSGSIISNMFTGSNYGFSVGASTSGYGFDTLKFVTNSSRTDYWVDNIIVSTSTIPEPAAVSTIIGLMASLLLIIRLRRNI